MSASAYPEYPDELKASIWEKDKKSGFEAKSDVADKLKALQKRCDAVDWKLFAEGWARSLKSAAELEAEAARRNKVFAGSVLPLKKEAQAVAGVAKAAEKKAGKELLATLKSIGKAADAYAAAVDQCGEALRQAIGKAEDALPEEEDEESAPSALVDPKQLFKQLTQCRRDPDRRVKFAFVDAHGEQPAMMAVHPRMTARALFAKLQAASGVKAGTYGMAWVDDRTLMLQLDKPQSGVVKKVRAPVKACGFSIAKVVLWNEDGTVFEQDELADEAGAGTAPQPDARPAPEAAGGTVDAAQAFKARLAAALPGIQAAIQAGSGNAAAIRLKFGQMGVLAKKPDYPGAQTVLDEIDELMVGQRPAAAPPAGARPAPPADSPQAEVDALRASLKDDYDALLRGPLTPALREGFQPIANAWTVAQDSTDKGLHDRALLILKKIADAGTLARLRQAMGAPSGGAKATPPLDVLQKARLVWDGMRKGVQSQFAEIRGAVMTAVRAHNADPEQEDEFDEAEIGQKLDALFVSLDTMDQGLIDKLDEALNAEGAQRDARYAEAAVLVRDFRNFAASDPTLAFIDDNGFASTDIRARVDKALADLGDQI